MVTQITGLLFLTSAGGAIGSPGVEGLFFARFGVQFLPYLYIALGFITLSTSLFITSLFGRVSHGRLYATLPLALAALLVGERIVVGFDPTWFYPVLWLSMNVLWLLQSLFTWGLAGAVCDTRQAKRLFPLFGVGGILGLTCGSLVTRPLVQWIGTENLLLVWAGALVLAFALVGSLMRRTHIGNGERRTHRRVSRNPGWLVELQRGMRHVRQSPLLRWMAFAAVLFAVLYYALVFPFSKAVAAAYPDEADVAAFLGTFQGVSTGSAALISLFLANRMYARFGFMTMILVYPILYLIGFTGMVFWASFWPLVAFRYLQILWSEGVSNGANQAMFNVVPAGKREHARAFIRGVANQVGISLAGVMLLFSQTTLLPRHVYAIGGIAALATCFFVWRARSAYGKAVLEALRAGQPQLFFSEERPFGGFRQDAAALSAVLDGIGNPDPAVRRVSAEILGNISLSEATEAIVDALNDEDPGVRAALIRALVRAKDHRALLEIAARLQDPHPEVRAEAVRALGKLAGYPHGVRVHLQPLLEDPDPGVRASAAAIVLASGSNEQAEQALRDLVTEGTLEARTQALESLAHWGTQSAYDLAARSLEDPLPVIRQAAARVLARIDANECVQPLVGMLGDEDRGVREAAAKALGEVGDRALQPTLEALEKEATEAGALQALRGLPVREFAADLRHYARRKRDEALRYHELYRKSLSAPAADGRVGLVIDSLSDAAQQHGRRGLLAIGLLKDPDAFDLALENLDRDDPILRANALETIDSLGDTEIAHPILQVWEEREPIEAPPAEIISTVLEDEDPWMRACAALAASRVSEARIESALKQLAHEDTDPLVRETARLALEGDSPMDTLPTLSVMERVLFLRKVPLFAKLPPPDLKQIASIANELYFPDGERIAEQGEQGDEMFVIVSGEVQVMVETDEGDELELARRNSGEYVGEMAIISQAPRMASLDASGEVRLLCIDQEEFEGMLRLRPETSLTVMRVLCDRLRETTESIET